MGSNGDGSQRVVAARGVPSCAPAIIIQGQPPDSITVRVARATAAHSGFLKSRFSTLTSSSTNWYTYVTTLPPWMSISTNDGATSASSAEYAPVADPGLMKNLPSRSYASN
jgi:hypothetical protein